MTIQNIAGYKFLTLDDLEAWKARFQAACSNVLGTILLSHEGVNLSLAGPLAAIEQFKSWLKQQAELSDLTFRESYSDAIPFKTLKIKIKPEIITLKQPETAPLQRRGAAISPQVLKQWLDEARDITLLDTRNDYEVRFGTFKGAINPKVDQFSDLPSKITDLDKKKPVVMYCTGGIRCEKAAVYFENQGFEEVYQLDGGILGYFAEVGGPHYEGECFVFDERIAVDPTLACTGTKQCTQCQGPIKAAQNACQECA